RSGRTSLPPIPLPRAPPAGEALPPGSLPTPAGLELLLPRPRWHQTRPAGPAARRGTGCSTRAAAPLSALVPPLERGPRPPDATAPPASAAAARIVRGGALAPLCS